MNEKDIQALIDAGHKQINGVWQKEGFAILQPVNLPTEMIYFLIMRMADYKVFSGAEYRDVHDAIIAIERVLGNKKYNKHHSINIFPILKNSEVCV